MGDWRSPWHQTLDAVHTAYGGQLKKMVQDLPTPALVVDLDVLERNMRVMAAALPSSGIRLRPHTKVQKCPHVAMLQVEAGALGMTTQSVWEAAGLAAAGVPDLLIATEFTGHDKLRAAAELARHVRLSIVVDDRRAIAQVSQAATVAGTSLDVLIDLDVGMGRTGARSAQDALELARLVDSAPGLQLTGIQAYEGHCVIEPDPAERIRLAIAAMDYAASVRQLFEQAGLHAPVLSAGGTVTYESTGTHPAVTELQAGSYVFMDTVHRALTPAFEISLTVHATVVDQHGDLAILDAGGKSVGSAFASPPIQGADGEASYYLPDGAADFAPRLGDRVRLVCGYAPNAINLYDVIFAVRDDQVQEVWPVFPRGPGQHGFHSSLVGT